MVEASLNARMEGLVTGRTDKALTDRFGISYNTWRKLLAGEPIRRSVAERLALRGRSIEEREQRPD